MKCLSICQPFAELIIQNKKTVELRTWNTKIRGEFLVHAPIKIRKEDYKKLKIKEKLTTGAIIGKVELYDVKKYESLKEMKSDKKKHFASMINKVELNYFMDHEKINQFCNYKHINKI